MRGHAPRQKANTSSMSSLSAVIYRSRAVSPQADLDLLYLLAHARQRNEALGLSGLMIYDRGFFFQWLEGDDVPLGKVWNSIRRDPRHRDLLVLADQPIPVRLFDDWHMQFAHRDRLHESIVDGFSVAHPRLLDDLHLNPEKTPSILATFSTLGGSAFATA